MLRSRRARTCRQNHRGRVYLQHFHASVGSAGLGHEAGQAGDVFVEGVTLEYGRAPGGSHPFGLGRVFEEVGDCLSERSGVTRRDVEAFDPVVYDVDLALRSSDDDRLPHRHRLGDRCHPGIEVDVDERHDDEARAGIELSQRQERELESVAHVRRKRVRRESFLDQLGSLALMLRTCDEAADRQLDPYREAAHRLDERLVVAKPGDATNGADHILRLDFHRAPEVLVDRLEFEVETVCGQAVALRGQIELDAAVTDDRPDMCLDVEMFEVGTLRSAHQTARNENEVTPGAGELEEQRELQPDPIRPGDDVAVAVPPDERLYHLALDRSGGAGHGPGHGVPMTCEEVEVDHLGVETPRELDVEASRPCSFGGLLSELVDRALTGPPAHDESIRLLLVNGASSLASNRQATLTALHLGADRGLGEHSVADGWVRSG
jgi:hypothetical protein